MAQVVAPAAQANSNTQTASSATAASGTTSTLPGNASSPLTQIVQDPDLALSQAIDILDKQYRLYSWHDSKALSLITTNSILFAVFGFLFPSCLKDVFAMTSLGLGLLLLSASIFIVLSQVIPQGSSGLSGSTPLIRSLKGIGSHANWQDYYSQFVSMNKINFLEHAVRQIYGMVINNNKSTRSISTAVKLTNSSIVFVVCTFLGAGLAAQDIHLLGTWSESMKAETSPLVSEKSQDTKQSVVSPRIGH